VLLKKCNLVMHTLLKSIARTDIKMAEGVVFYLGRMNESQAVFRVLVVKVPKPTKRD
jgi:hypothetical protein